MGAMNTARFMLIGGLLLSGAARSFAVPGATAATGNTTLSAEQKRAKIAEYLSAAMAATDRIDYVGYRQATFSGIAETRLLAGDKDGAREALKKAEQCEVNPGERIWTDIYFARAQVISGDAGAALKTIDSLDNPKSRDNGHRELAATLAMLGDIAGAKAMVDKISDEKAKQQAWQRIAKAQARGGDLAGARVSMASLSDTAAKWRVSRVIAEAEAKAGKAAAALATADTITDARLKQKTLFEIAEAETKIGHKDDALHAYELVIAVADKLNALDKKISAYCEIAVGMARNGDKAAAKAIFDKARQMQKDVKPVASPTGAPSIVHSRLPDAMVRAGDIAGAIEEANGDAAECAWSITMQQVEAGDFAGAHKTAASTKDNIDTILIIAYAEAKAGDLAGVRKSVDSLDTNEAQVRQHYTLFRNIGTAHSAAGELNALEAWAEFHRDAPAIQANLLLGAARGLMPPVPKEEIDYD